MVSPFTKIISRFPSLRGKEINFLLQDPMCGADSGRGSGFHSPGKLLSVGSAFGLFVLYQPQLLCPMNGKRQTNHTNSPVHHYPASSWLSGSSMCLWDVNPWGWNSSWFPLRAARTSSGDEQPGAVILLEHKGSIHRALSHSTKRHSWIPSAKEMGLSAKTTLDLCSAPCCKGRPKGRAATGRERASAHSAAWLGRCAAEFGAAMRISGFPEGDAAKLQQQAPQSCQETRDSAKEHKKRHICIFHGLDHRLPVPRECQETSIY